MVQFFDLTPRPSSASMIGQAIGQGIGNYNRNQQQQTQQGQLANLLFGNQGSQFANLPADQQLKVAELMQDQLKNEMQGNLKAQQANEKIAPIMGGLNTLNRMRQIRKEGNLGRLEPVYSLFGGKTAEQAGEYQQLGKSLISLSTNIPIRNRIEFETLAHDLYDPSITDKKAEGILNAMERILKTSLSAYQTGEELEQETPQQQKERPPLSSFNR